METSPITTPTTTPTGLKGVFEYLDHAFRDFGKHWRMLVLISIAPALSALIIMLYYLGLVITGLGLSALSTEEQVAQSVMAGFGVGMALLFTVIMVLAVVATIWSQLALTIYVKEDFKPGFKESFAKAWKRLLPYIGLNILIGIILGIGYTVFIIPGVILSVWLAFSVYIFVLEETPALKSFGLSMAVIKGRGWRVFGYFLVYIILAGVAGGIIGFIPFVGTVVLTLVLTPVSVLVVVAMYRDLKVAQGDAYQTKLNEAKK